MIKIIPALLLLTSSLSLFAENNDLKDFAKTDSDRDTELNIDFRKSSDDITIDASNHQRVVTMPYQKDKIYQARMAYGYPLQIVFDSDVKIVSAGFGAMLSVERDMEDEKVLYFKPRVTSGNTEIHLKTEKKSYIIHLMVGSHAIAHSKIYLGYEPEDSMRLLADGVDLDAGNKKLDLVKFARITRNFDILKKRKQINDTIARRATIARRSPDSAFTYYNAFAFYREGYAAITFKYANLGQTNESIEYDKIYLLVGGKLIKPKATYASKSELRPHESTTGRIIFPLSVLKSPDFRNFDIVFSRD